jgi:hypothetical protein
VAFLPAAFLAGWILPVTVNRTAAGSAAADQPGMLAAKTTANHHATNLFFIITFDTELNENHLKVLFNHKKLRNHVMFFLLSQSL